MIYTFRANTLTAYPIDEIEKLASFSGVVYSSPEVGEFQQVILLNHFAKVWDGSSGMAYKLHFSGRILSLVVDEAGL